MLHIEYNHYGTLQICTLHDVTSYFRGKRLVFEGEPFEHNGRWYQFRLVVRRRSLRLEKAQGRQPDRMYGYNQFKIKSVTHIK